MNTHKRYTTRSLTRYVVFSISMIITYTIVSLVFACLGIEVPEVLTTGWYSVFGGEILSCCVIKLFKLVKKEE